MHSVALKTNGQVRPARNRLPDPRPVSRLSIYWFAFVGSVVCFVLLNTVSVWPAPFAVMLGIASSVTCGLAWLLARSLFRRSEKADGWPVALVGVLFICTLIARFADVDTSNAMLTYMGNLQALIGSAMLVLIALEALNGSDMNAVDKPFRNAFLGTYLTILAVALAARLPELSEWQTLIQVSLSIIGALAATLAVLYRRRQFDEVKSLADEKTLNPELAGRLIRLMEEAALYRQPGLKVADLARQLNAPDYCVSQVIVNDIGQPNFNRWVNRYRIEDAKMRLSAPGADRLSILNLSHDCGFNSLGPFNRAFKAETGMTPSEYRQKLRAARI